MAKEYTKEQLNYFRICYVTTDVLADGLREIFKKEWDKLYKSTKGEWKDKLRNGIDFYNGVSSKAKKKRSSFGHYEKTGTEGNGIVQCCFTLSFSLIPSGHVFVQ